MRTVFILQDSVLQELRRDRAGGGEGRVGRGEMEWGGQVAVRGRSWVRQGRV